jgi:uncharacterized membrane protein
VSDSSLDALPKILGFAAVLEVGTGLVLMIDPAIVVTLLVDANEPAEAMPLGRIAGIAMLALGFACWPTRQRASIRSPAFRAMWIYNVLVALYLAYLGAIGHLGGVLLWPAVAVHAVVTLLLVWLWRREGRTQAADR